MTKAPVLVLDFGSQTTKLIARRLRELGHFSKIVPGWVSLDRLMEEAPAAVILSGGPASVDTAGSPRLAVGFWEWQKSKQIPVLGICYGMQLMARDLKGDLRSSIRREYGLSQINWDSGTGQQVWMSHGDDVGVMPAQFVERARSTDGVLAAMECQEDLRLGIQFHPEVTHTQNGTEFLQQWVEMTAGLKPNWDVRTEVNSSIESIRQKVGPTERALCALSGGVDSTVAAVLVQKAIGDRLSCVFVDHGLLRDGESDEVMGMFHDALGLKVERIDASERFLSQLAGIEDPEEKRKRIGSEFISVFREVARANESQTQKRAKFLVQGTLYPDVIESGVQVFDGPATAVKIKSHHNVGGLPKDLGFELLEPLRELFKDEVRELGRELGIPPSFLERHPFPGPGLAVRIVGEVTSERLAILRQVDRIFRDEIATAGLNRAIWQAFAVFLPIRSVGVMGDGRSHDHVVALRAVTSIDGMTADWYPFESAFLARTSRRICNEVRGVNRVVYDISSKPPATIEWE